MLAKLFENDLRTTYGNNLRKISNICGMNIDELTSQKVKMNMKYREVPLNEEWRLPILNEMLFARDHHIEVEGLSRRDINDIINFVCTA